MAETQLVAEELGKVVGFEVKSEGRTGLDLDSLWGVKGKRRQRSFPSPLWDH